MALTITPPVGAQVWIPSGNEIKFTITTDTAWRSDLYFLVDIIVNGNTVLTLRKYPLRGQQSVVLNVQEVVDVYLENRSWVGIGTTVFESPTYGTTASLQITATEWYSGEAWTTASSMPVYVWKAAEPFLSRRDTININRFGWEFTASTSLTSNGYHGRPMGYHKTAGYNTQIFDIRTGGMYLTDAVKRFAYKMNRHARRDVHIFTSYYGNTNHIIFYGCDADGKVIKKARTYTSSTPTIYEDKHLMRWEVRGDGINLDTYIPNTATNMSDCKYIVCVVSSTYGMTLDAVETFISQPLVFKICDCDESFAVWYKSYEGGWNIIQCNKRATEQTEIETVTMENTIPQTWAIDSRIISAVNVTARSTWTLNTDWIDKMENEDVRDMLQSPCLFIQQYVDGKLTYIPVTLANATYTTKEVNANSLFNYKLVFVESYYKNTVRP